MAKIFPQPSTNSCSSSGRETFTVWMKSLVFHSNGCTVFNSEGDVAFRVDNYQKRCSRKVFLMDSTGNLLFSLNRKKAGIMGGCWEGFKWIDSDVRMERPWFKVRRNRAILGKDLSCRVILGCDKNTKDYYRITGFEGKSTLKITDFSGKILAEATQKQSSEGVDFGDDVLRLVVEEHADQSLIMALITVYGLINGKL